MKVNKILFVIGTRPELIKVAPIIYEFKKKGFEDYAVVSTGQHRNLLTKYWKLFDIYPDYSLDILSPSQSLSRLTAKAITELDNLILLFQESGQKPDIILAQGDTTTVMAASMVAFYNKIKFFHLEAGLRSFHLDQPFPEEYNRKVASISAYAHLAPTEISKQNLSSEGIDESKIHVVGNTIVDALELMRRSEKFDEVNFNDPELQINNKTDIVIITCHRRENQGENLLNIINAISFLASRYTKYFFVWLKHPNPQVKSLIEEADINQRSNFLSIDPLDYLDTLKLISRAKIIITDSGGIQEEAPSFGKPLIVLREVTERPEAVWKGMAKLVGADQQAIFEAFEWANDYQPAIIFNPYGDGFASLRVANLLLQEISS
ncbi:MAG: non-hydrolyzing UDP-N-acetylglucosamine 2-epimerase [Agriterribacter sp.]